MAKQQQRQFPVDNKSSFLLSNGLKRNWYCSSSTESSSSGSESSDEDSTAAEEDEPEMEPIKVAKKRRKVSKKNRLRRKAEALLRLAAQADKGDERYSTNTNPRTVTNFRLVLALHFIRYLERYRINIWK